MSTVHEALAAAAAEVGAVRKDSRNPQQGFSFRGIDAVMTAVAPAFRRHGLLGPVPELQSLTREEAGASRNGARITRVTVTVAYTVYGPDGDKISGTVPGEATDTSDKATAKAMSVALRTFLLQALCLPTDEPDPDSAYVEHSPEGEARAACNSLVQRFVARFGGDPEKLAAEYQREGGTADPDALTKWLTARIPNQTPEGTDHDQQQP